MKRLKTALIAVTLIAGAIISSCNQTKTKSDVDSSIDTLAIVAKIDKQIDSLGKLVSPDRKKVIFREKAESEPLHNNYFYDTNGNLIQVDIEYYDGGTTYHVTDGKIIRMMHADEAGEGNIYVINNKTFCKMGWNGEKMTLFSTTDANRNWKQELNELIDASKTKPLSEGEKKLIGDHKLRLQWLSKTGTAKIHEENGVLKIDGEHTEKDGFVKIKGNIEYVNDKEIIIKGTVSTKSSIVNNNEVCERSGDFNFKSTKGRKYWRMQQMDNCEGNRVVDYIDIFF